MFSEIRTKIRAILNDNSTSGKDIFTYEGNSRSFSLSEDHVISVTAVYVNDVQVASSGNWSYSSSVNKLIFENSYSFTVSDVIEVDCEYYKDYSNNELDGYIRASISYISIHRYKTFEINDDDINPEPSEEEQNLIAVIASILIRPENKSYRLPDLTVTVPIGAMPTDEMIRRVIGSFKRNTHGVFFISEDLGGC